jgi:SAM-dependent methyltransferase
MTASIGCLVCGGNADVRLRWRPKKHHPAYYACRGCGLVFAHPQNDPDYEHGPSTLPSDDEYRARMRNFAVRYERLRPFLPGKALRLLDVGCQNGVFLAYAKEAGCEVLGIEPSIEYARYARETTGVDVIGGSFEAYPFTQRFDLITLFNVLEHTKDPRQVLTKAHGLLEGSGLLVLELPYVFTPQGLLSRQRWHHFEETHHWFFGRRNIRRLLQDVGYEVLSTSFVPKVVPLTRMLDCLLSRTVYLYVQRSTYLRMREGRVYRALSRIDLRVNIMDYLFVVARRQTR